MLHLDSSAGLPGESVTRELTARFALAWRAGHATAGYRYRDLAASPVAPVDTAFCELGRRLERDGLVPLEEVAARAASPAEERQWALALPLVREVRDATVLLIGAPMYNLGVPALLKSWIDRISVPGAFTDLGTGRSVLSGTRVVLVTARGGTGLRDAPGAPVPYLSAYFRKLGVPGDAIDVISAELTVAGLVPGMAGLRPRAEGSLARARAAVTRLATPVSPAASPAS
jgi:FMN-dependent NADH-azoreductase